jgi:hypothetical protein
MGSRERADFANVLSCFLEAKGKNTLCVKGGGYDTQGSQ